MLTRVNISFRHANDLIILAYRVAFRYGLGCHFVSRVYRIERRQCFFLNSGICAQCSTGNHNIVGWAQSYSLGHGSAHWLCILGF